MILAVAPATYVSVAVGILGVTALVAAAFAVLRSNLAKTTAELWKGEAEATRAKADRLEKDHTACTARLDALQEKYDELDERYREIEKLVKEALQGTWVQATTRASRATKKKKAI